MTRFCEGCRRSRHLREFDLREGQPGATCRDCARESDTTSDHRARAERHEQLAALERQRRSLIAALVKIDAEIAALRGRPSSSSSSFKRVEPIDVDDTDLGFGD